MELVKIAVWYLQDFETICLASFELYESLKVFKYENKKGLSKNADCQAKLRIYINVSPKWLLGKDPNY